MSFSLSSKKLGNSSLIKLVGIYSLSSFLAKSVSFLLIPLFTNLTYMSTEDNGILSLLNRSTLFLLPFISMGVLQSAQTDYFKLTKKDFSSFLTSGMLLSLSVLLVSLIIFSAGQSFFLNKYNLPKHFIWAVPIIAFFTFIIELWLAFLRNQNKAWHFMWVNLVRIILELSIAIILITFYQYHWKGRLIGILIAAILIGLIGIIYFHKQGYLKEAPQKKYFSQELLYAIPIVLMQFGVFCMSSSDSFFLADKNPNYKGLIGVYGIACTFATIVNVLVISYLMYLMPKIYSLLAEATINYKQIRKQFYYYLIVAGSGLLLVFVAVPIFYKLFIPKVYHSALPYFYLITTGYTLWAITYFFYSFLLFYKKKKLITILSVINIVISLLVYYFFIQKWNIWGAAIGVLVSYFTILIITLLLCKKYIKLIFSNK